MTNEDGRGEAAHRGHGHPAGPRRSDQPHDHHQHGHANDRGIKGALRYLRWLPQLWRSEINDAVVALVRPQPGERVVDIGAGLGAGAMRAAATGAHVIAVEPTPFLRRLLATRRALSRRRARVEVVAGSAERIPVDDHTVDAIWAVNTMHHWVDLERGVAEIARVLRSDGRVVLVDEVFTDPAHPEHRRFGTDHDREQHGFTAVGVEPMGDLLRAAGLADVDAANRQLAGRPVLSISASGRPPTER